MTKAPPYYELHSKVGLRLSLRYYKKYPFHNQYMVTKGYHWVIGQKVCVTNPNKLENL